MRPIGIAELKEARRIRYKDQWCTLSRYPRSMENRVTSRSAWRFIDVEVTTMRLSLLKFLNTGQLGDVGPGSPKHQIHDHFGSADAVSTDKKGREDIWKYGSVEFFLSTAGDCTGVFIESVTERLHFPKTWTIDDWDVQPGMHLNRLEEFLVRHHVRYSIRSKEVDQIVIECSGVEITLEDDRRVGSFFSGHDKA